MTEEKHEHLWILESWQAGDSAVYVSAINSWYDDARLSWICKCSATLTELVRSGVIPKESIIVGMERPT